MRRNFVSFHRDADREHVSFKLITDASRSGGLHVNVSVFLFCDTKFPRVLKSAVLTLKLVALRLRDAQFLSVLLNETRRRRMVLLETPRLGTDRDLVTI